MISQRPPLQSQRYRPFSNGTEFDIWHSRNCALCTRCDLDSPPTCPGDEALALALLDDGTISTEAADFIATQHRDVQGNGKGFCKLQTQCHHFESRYPYSVLTCLDSMTRDQVARHYAELLDNPTVPGDAYGPLNQLIIEKWSLSALDYIKRQAWRIHGSN